MGVGSGSGGEVVLGLRLTPSRLYERGSLVKAGAQSSQTVSCSLWLLVRG